MRCFSPFTLQFVTTLPRTHYLGVDVAKGLSISHMASHPASAKYPDTVALTYDESNHKVTCVYSDRSLYLWDVTDIRKVRCHCRTFICELVCSCWRADLLFGFGSWLLMDSRRAMIVMMIIITTGVRYFPFQVGKSHSFLYHAACIWGVEAYPSSKEGMKGVLPGGSFVTCSSDDTIRVWNLDPNMGTNTIYKRNIYSNVSLPE